MKNELPKKSAGQQLDHELPQVDNDQPVDIMELVDQSKSGDEEALNTLAETLQPQILRFYKNRIPNSDDAEDLAQESLMKIVEKLDTFDPNLGKGTPRRNFESWTYTITRRTWIDQWRKKASNKEEPLEDYDFERNLDIATYDQDPDEDLPDISGKFDLNSAEFQEKLGNILKPKQLEIVMLKVSGKENAEIAHILEISEGTMRVRLHRARKIIETEYIHPSGLVRLSTYGDHRLHFGANRGSLPAVRFLGHFYSTDDWVKQYLSTHPIHDDSLLEEGYVVLHQVCTPAEYNMLVKGKRQLAVKYKNRWYIKPEDLARFRENRKLAPPRRIPSPGEGYIRLHDIAQTGNEYSILKKAARSGKLKATKVNNLWWYTTEEAVEEYLNLYPPKRRLKNQGTIFDRNESE